MSLILPGLILGGFEESFDRCLLASYKVTHVLNVAIECNVSERVGMHYAKFALPDDCPLSDITLVFKESIEFIQKARETDTGCVFVHCLEGVSRSACVVLYYMVHQLGWEFGVALAHMRTCRPIVEPFPLYLTQTHNYLIHSTKCLRV
jgi:dual specificity phosphatase 12